MFFFFLLFKHGLYTAKPFLSAVAFRAFKCTTISLRPSEENSNILLFKRFPLLLNKLLAFSSQTETSDPNLQKLF